LGSSKSFKINIEKMEKEKDVSGLINALKNGDMSVRAKAAVALGKIGDARAYEPLLLALKDRYSYVRSRVAVALSKLGNVNAVEKFIMHLRDRNPDVRAASAEILGYIADERSIPPLIQVLRDPNEHVRWYAEVALTNMGQIVVGSMIHLLKDKDSGIRRRATRILGYTGDERAVEPLTQALNDSDSRVCEDAKEALESVHRRIKAKGNARSQTPTGNP